MATHSVVMDLRRDPLYRDSGRTIITLGESASAVSTCLTVVDNSCVVNHQEGTPVVRRDESYRHSGQPCTGKDALVENTLRVGCQYRIVLRFMGTVEESLMTRQFRTRVRYIG